MISHVEPSISRILTEKPDTDAYFHSCLISFKLTLYNEPLLSRKIIQDFISNISSLFKNFLFILKNTNSNVSSENKNKDQEFNTLLDNLKNIFHSVSTEHKRFKYLEKYKSYTTPQPYIIDQAKMAKKTNDVMVDKVMNVTVVTIPLKNSLKSILEKPGILDDIKKYMNDL